MKFLICLLSLTLLVSCGIKKKKTNNDETGTVNNEQHISYPQAEIGEFDKTSAPVKITHVELKRNYLELTVTYSGGCNTHDFRLIGSPITTKSLPPIRNIQLAHRTNGDNCKALVEEKLTFSISVLAENYEPGNKIVLKLENYKPDITYTYE